MIKICRIHRPPLNELFKKFPQRELHVLNCMENRGHSVTRYQLTPAKIKNRYLSYGLGFLLGIVRFKKVKTDILVADDIESGIAAMLIKFIYSTPFVFDFIDDYSAITRHDGFKLRYVLIRIFEKLLPQLADLIIVVDEHKERYILRIGVKKEKIVLIPNGTDTQKFCPDIQPANLFDQNASANNKIVLYMGKINKYYCLERIIKAVQHVLSKFHVKFVFIGDGDNMHGLKDLCKRLQIGDAVLFTGFKKHEEIPSFIMCADVCVFPLPDSSALAIYEYMACGKATVVPGEGNEKMGINDDLIPGDCVVRVENSPLGFARGINRLLDDSLLREKIGKRARQFVVDSFDWNDLALRYEAALKAVVEKRKGIFKK